MSDMPNYKVVVTHVQEDDLYRYYIAEGDGFSGLAMGAPSIDVLMERVSLALSDLFEVDKFTISYQLDFVQEVNFRCCQDTK